MIKKEIVFDVNILLETAENDGDWAKQLFEMFRKDTKDRIEAIRSNLKDLDPDIDLIRIHFHTIKSSAGSVGAVSLKELALKLEEASRNRDVRLIIEKIDDFEDITRMSLAAFEKTVERMF